MKVKRIKDAFEKPFRGSGSTTLPFASQRQVEVREGATDSRLAAKDKGKQRVAAEVEMRPPREPSPVWDLELDLNTPPPDEPYVPPSPQSRRPEVTDASRKRPASPVWDIELDLNPSDVDEPEGTANKRHKSTHPEGDDAQDDGDGFGETNLLI